MLEFTPQGQHTAECSETGAYLTATRAQWTLVYERGDWRSPDHVYETRHWQRAKVPASEILAKAQKSLDKIIAKHQ